MHLLVLRPEPGARATADRGAALGHRMTVAPLFTIVPVAWRPPDPVAHDALLLTSANAVREAGEGLASLSALPVFAVGAATAAAARGAGLCVVDVGAGDAAALLDRLAVAGVTRPLHLAGAEHRAVERAGVALTRIIVYRADAADRLPVDAVAAINEGAIVLLHSPRAAALFASLSDRRRRGTIPIAAISAAAAEAAGAGWNAVAIARFPTDDALLAAAATLCDTPATPHYRAGDR